MGINIILPLIIGMALMVSLGSQVVPSFVEQMKVAKIENRTISNQNLIKDAIVRYIKMEKKVPKDLEELKASGLLRNYHESNLFNGGYSFTIDKKKGTLKIFTKIDDKDAGKYFSNSFKSPNAPTCKQALDSNGVCVSGEFETFYLLDEDTFKSIPIPPIGSIEDIEDRFTKVEEVGKKFDKATLVGGEKDYIVDLVTKKVTEYTYDKDKKEWVENPTKIVVPSLNPSDHGVEIKNITWNFIDGLGNDVKQTHEKVVCNATSINKEVFVVNQITGLGEFVWVAPNISPIQTKIFGNDAPSKRQNATNIVGNGANDLKYIPNNICTSNVTSMMDMFDKATNFDQPLNRWDTSRVVDMKYMFYGAKNFNQALNFDTSKVMDMEKMFYDVKKFDQELNLDTSRVTNMRYMFFGAKKFNQPLSFNTSKVTDMSGMFYDATIFNQPLNFVTSSVTSTKEMFRDATIFNQDINNWDVSKVTNMDSMFSNATNFNQDINSWCVFNILDKPTSFDSSTPSWLKTLNADGKIALQPQWGQPCH